jgi:hypothetical protein
MAYTQENLRCIAGLAASARNQTGTANGDNSAGEHCRKCKEHADLAKDEVFRMPANANGVEEASGDQAAANEMKNPNLGNLKLCQEHQHQGEGDVFGKIAMDPDAPCQNVITSITNTDSHRAPLKNDAQAQDDE